MSSPFADAAIRPLTIAHLCAIYERAGRIPDKPKTVYRKIVNLLLEEWDEQRSVKRQSSYANFEVDRKFEFLTNLAYVLTTSARGAVFRKKDLINAYEKIHENFGLPLGEAAKVANELESHTGLFIQAGYELFEFSHKSLQEYLTAEFIVRLPAVPRHPSLLLNIPNELAIATAISSQASQYLTHLIFERFSGLRPKFGFIRAFVTRLLLESPDFERTTAVGSALLALYSQYLQAFQSQSKQLSLFVYDQLASEFSALGGMIKDRVPISELLDTYQVVSKPEGLDGQRLFLLERRTLQPAGTKRHRSRLYDALPDELWVRESLLQRSSEPLG
jgi:hypothetical protein